MHGYNQALLKLQYFILTLQYVAVPKQPVQPNAPGKVVKVKCLLINYRDQSMYPLPAHRAHERTFRICMLNKLKSQFPSTNTAIHCSQGSHSLYILTSSSSSLSLSPASLKQAK